MNYHSFPTVCGLNSTRSWTMYSSPSKSPMKAGPAPCRPGQYSAQFSPKAMEIRPVKSYNCSLRSPQSTHRPGGLRADRSPIPRHSLQSAYKQAVNDAYVHLPSSTPALKHSGGKHIQFELPKASDMCQLRMTKEPSRNLLPSFSDELAGPVQEESCAPDLALCCESAALLPTLHEAQPLRTSVSPPPPVELIDSVMTGDALSGIMERLARQDIGNLRLTCKSWGASIRQKVTALAPARVPPNNVRERFPAASRLDLTSLGAKRFRSIKGSMVSCKSMLTSLEIGDNKYGGGSWICNQDMNTLSSLHKLQSLKIYNPKSLTQRGIENLSQLHELEDLTIDKCKNLSLSLAHTCALWPALKTLRLGGCKLHTPYGDTSELEHDHGMNELFLRSCSIQDPGMLEICSFKSLQSLRIEKTILDCSMTSSAIQQLSTLTALTQLKVVNVSTEPQVLCSILTRLPYLKSLKVVYTSKATRKVPGMLECFTSLKHLEEVDLEGIKVPWKLLDMLPSAKSITMSCPTDDSPESAHTAVSKVETLILRSVQSNFKLPLSLAKLRSLITIAVCVEEGSTKKSVLGRSLQELMAGECRVLAYEYDSTSGRWKAAALS